jgi:hypothetical protein
MINYNSFKVGKWGQALIEDTGAKGPFVKSTVPPVASHLRRPHLCPSKAGCQEQMSPWGCRAYGVTLRADSLLSRFVLLCNDERHGLEGVKRHGAKRYGEKSNLTIQGALSASFLFGEYNNLLQGFCPMSRPDPIIAQYKEVLIKILEQEGSGNENKSF